MHPCNAVNRSTYEINLGTADPVTWVQLVIFCVLNAFTTMFPNQTADQRLAMIPEILSQIFEGSWRGDQVRSPRVSRFWCNLVLNLIWRRLDDLGVLFRLLAPLTTSNGVIVSIPYSFRTTFVDKLRSRHLPVH